MKTNALLSMTIMVVSLACNQCLAMWHYCDVGVPSHAVPAYMYQTPYHHTEWDAWDYQIVAMAFGSPPITPYIREQATINGITADPHVVMMTSFGPLPQQVDWYLWHAQNGSHTISADFDYGQYSGSYGFMSAFAYLGTCSHTGTVTNIPVVSLSEPTTLTLNDNYTAHVTYVPDWMDVTSTKIEMKRSGSSTWYTIHQNANPYFDTYARVAGTWKVRASVSYGGANYQTPEYTQTVNFMPYSAIIADPIAANAGIAAWDAIKDYADTHTADRVEKAFWISFNTASRQYVVSQVFTSNPAICNGTQNVPPCLGSVNPGTKPADSIANPTPLDSPTYTVGIFHGHTPFRRVHPNHCRPTGASDTDITHANNNNVVGILWDYNASLHCGGTSLGASSGVKNYGPQNRSTP